MWKGKKENFVLDVGAGEEIILTADVASGSWLPSKSVLLFEPNQRETVFLVVPLHKEEFWILPNHYNNLSCHIMIKTRFMVCNIY